MPFRTMCEFGNELKRLFRLQEHYYDCSKVYGGCNAWPTSDPFRSADYPRPPDVMPGTRRQVFPPSRMKDHPVVPRDLRIPCPIVSLVFTTGIKISGMVQEGGFQGDKGLGGSVASTKDRLVGGNRRREGWTCQLRRNLV
jgi:hypothetical protein